MNKIKLQKLKTALNSKLNDSISRKVKLALQAGVFISTGSILYGLATSYYPQISSIRLLGAMTFTVGLYLVIFLKAQLFTGNNLMFLKLKDQDSEPSRILENWFFVYIGNFFGSLFMVTLFYFLLSDYETFKLRFISIAETKVNYSFLTSYIKAIFCNILVCLAVWFGVTSKKKISKVTGIFVPITLFVFLGFEHSVANMFFIPLGLSLGKYALNEGLLLFIGNIFPVTLGNITGGLVLSLVLLFGAKKG